jgi:hypothetical protein
VSDTNGKTSTAITVQNLMYFRLNSRSDVFFVVVVVVVVVLPHTFCNLYDFVSALTCGM